jgi:hypothetical protein
VRSKLKQLIGLKVAGNVLLVAFVLVVGFHLLVLLGLVPPDIVWGGQIGASSSNLIVLESIALVVSLFFAVVTAAKLGYIQADRFKVAIRVCLWIIFAYLLLNTIGNLASVNSVEKAVFAAITLLLALFALRVAIER